MFGLPRGVFTLVLEKGVESSFRACVFRSVFGVEIPVSSPANLEGKNQLDRAAG